MGKKVLKWENGNYYVAIGHSFVHKRPHTQFLSSEVHTMLDALLPPDTYFRFNPLMNEDIPLDENRKEKLNQLQMDGIQYLERNEEKLKKAAKILIQEKTTLQRLNDWMKLKADMYEGLPFLSKL